MWMGPNVGGLGLCRAASRLARNRTGEGGAGGEERTSTVDGLDGHHREALVAYNPDFNLKEKKNKRFGQCMVSSHPRAPLPPDSQAYLSAALVSLAPPGGPYRKPPQFDASVHLVSHQSGVPPPHVLRAEAFPGLADSDDDVFNLPHLALPSAPGARTAEHQGWAVLPLFCGAGYVASGVHRLPLYLAQTGGEPSPALLEQIATEGERGVLAKARADRRVKLVEGASVDVAVLDELRAGEWGNGALPAPDVSALAEATGGKPDKYSNPRAFKPCQTLLSATVTEASLRAKFELALGFNGR
ncbi:hypothetical protein T492DRAFT_848042 [Pavlovales sp. CCMP2436]|nr:hypothetical protein T492DRAFT_848042 [Pavlovales sp. CCMP2436]